MTDEEIVAGLRSLDPETRAAAVEALNDKGPGMVMIVATPGGAEVTWSQRPDVSRVFQGALLLVQTFGEALGLKLGLVPAQQEPDKLQVATGLPPSPMMR